MRFDDLNDGQLDSLRVDVLTEIERRAAVESIPEQVAALANRYLQASSVKRGAPWTEPGVRGWLAGKVDETPLVFLARDYGVIGDGIADDTAALRSLLNAAARGGEVVLPADAQIKVTGALSVHSGTQIRGNGATISNDSVTGTVCTLANRTDIHIHDLHVVVGPAANFWNFYRCANSGVHGGSYRNGTHSSGSGIFIQGGSDVTVEDVRFDMLTRGISISNSGDAWAERVTVARCTFRAMLAAAVYVIGSESSAAATRDVHLVDLYADEFRDGGSTRSGYYITVGTGATVKHERPVMERCILRGRELAFSNGGNSDFITFYDCVDGKITDCNVYGGGDIGISVHRAHRNVLTGNIATANHSTGIGLWDASDNTIAGAVVRNNRRNWGYPPHPYSVSGDEVVTVGHGLQTGEKVFFGAGVPEGLSPDQSYFAQVVSADAFTLTNLANKAVSITGSAPDAYARWWIDGATRLRKGGVLVRGNSDHNTVVDVSGVDDQDEPTQEYTVTIEAEATGTKVIGITADGNVLGDVLDKGRDSVVM